MKYCALTKIVLATKWLHHVAAIKGGGIRGVDEIIDTKEVRSRKRKECDLVSLFDFYRLYHSCCTWLRLFLFTYGWYLMDKHGSLTTERPLLPLSVVHPEKRAQELSDFCQLHVRKRDCYGGIDIHINIWIVEVVQQCPYCRILCPWSVQLHSFQSNLNVSSLFCHNDAVHNYTPSPF